MQFEEDAFIPTCKIEESNRIILKGKEKKLNWRKDTHGSVRLYYGKVPSKHKHYFDWVLDCAVITPNRTTHYYQRDHLGSVRVVVNEAGALENTNSYSAFGNVTNTNAAYALNRYKYNGKELEHTHGIDCLDYGARWYEPVIGRFTTMDPLSEKYYHISPYAYCGNNPVNAIDPDGNVITYLNQHTGQQYIYLRGDFYIITPDAKGHFHKVTVKNSNDNFAYRLLMSLRKMDNSSNSLVRKVFSSISQSATSNHKIQQDKSSEVEPYDGTSSNVFLDFSLKGRQKDDFDGIGLTDYEIVGHELKHSYDIQFQK